MKDTEILHPFREAVKLILQNSLCLTREAVVLKPSNPAYPEIEVTAKNHFIYHGVVEGVLWKGIRKQ